MAITDRAADNEWGAAIWANFPLISSVRTNIPLTGFAIVFWVDIPNGVDYYPSDDLAWVVAPIPPVPSHASVITLPATNITEHSARLNGIIAADGGEAGAIRFEWGGTTAYGNQTPWRGFFPTGYEFNEDLSRLAEGSGFHFRAQFRNSLGIFNGNDQAFSTLTPLGPVTLIEDELTYLLEAT